MISLLVREKLYLSEVVLGTGFGILMGPHVANVFNPRSWSVENDKLTLEVMRIVLATGLFAIGVELPQSYMAKHAKSLLIMVIPTMAFGWVVSADYVSGLAISACLTPTDPVVSAAIIGGKYAVKHVPVGIRHLLAAESASNDGLAYPFLSISIYLTTESYRQAFGDWFLVGWLCASFFISPFGIPFFVSVTCYADIDITYSHVADQVILGTVLGAVLASASFPSLDSALLGLAFSYLMRYTHRKGFIDRESYAVQYLALVIFIIGIASTIGTDDLLAAFAAGSAISWDGYFNVQIENEMFSSIIDLVFNCASFIYIGAWLPFNQFDQPELGITPWRLVVLFSRHLDVEEDPAVV
ncbi:hypothetical protein EW146_g10429, partial [Bondarzewia mesenterica]